MGGGRGRAAGRREYKSGGRHRPPPQCRAPPGRSEGSVGPRRTGTGPFQTAAMSRLSLPALLGALLALVAAGPTQFFREEFGDGGEAGAGPGGLRGGEEEDPGRWGLAGPLRGRGPGGCPRGGGRPRGSPEVKGGEGGARSGSGGAMRRGGVRGEPRGLPGAGGQELGRGRGGWLWSQEGWLGGGCFLGRGSQEVFGGAEGSGSALGQSWGR